LLSYLNPSVYIDNQSLNMSSNFSKRRFSSLIMSSGFLEISGYLHGLSLS